MSLRSFLTTLPVLTTGMVLCATDYSTWIYQTKSDTTASPSSTAGYSFEGSSFWSSNVKPTAGYSYYVPHSITNYAQNKLAQDTTAQFAGDALAIGGVFSMKTGSRKTTFYKELHFLDGSLGLWSSVGSITGAIKIVSSELSPSTWRFVYSPTERKTYIVRIESDVSGDAGSCVRMERLGTTSKVALTWRFSGDWSEFYGDLVIADTMGTSFTTVKNLDFPGYLGSADGYALKIGEHVCTNYAAYSSGTLSVEETSGEVKTGNMKLKSGGILNMAYADGATAILSPSSLEIESGAKLCLDGLTVSDITASNTPPVIPVFRFAAGTAIPDVSGLEILPKVAGDLPNFCFTNIVDESGITDICITWKEIVYKTADDGSAQNSFSETNIKWSDGKMADAGKDYLCMKKTTLNSGSVVFKGDSLSLGNTTFYFTGKKLTATDLHFLPELTVDIYANDSTKVIDGGTLKLHPGDDDTPRIRFFQNRSLRIDSEITGSGTLRLYNKTGETSPYGTFIPRALNTNYHGRLILQTHSQAATDSIPQAPDAANNTCMRMIIGDARNLGGEFTADDNTYSAITISGQSLVQVTNSTAFAEPTRGIFIDNSARFKVSADKTLSLQNTLTLGGELWKEGEGELLFDGKVQFYAGEVLEDPVEGTNVVRVKAGSIRAGSPAATDGIAFVFSSGTYLVIDASDDASGYGLYLKKSGSSLTKEDDVSKIPVVLTGFDTASDSIVCAILTAASADEANALSNVIHVRRPAGFGSAKLAVRENDDGSATVVATIFRSGFTVTVR